MRYLVVGMGLGALLLLTGCPPWSQQHVKDQGNAPRMSAETPTAAQLLAYLNDNARRVPALECSDLWIDIKADDQNVALMGKLVCEKPRNFFLTAKAASIERARIGSNDREFWYWISEVKPTPYVFHCTYEEFNRGQAKLMPMPFQPEWIIEAMGVAPRDDKGRRNVVVKGNTVELEEAITSPQGQPQKKVTVFQRGQAAYGKPQVLEHRIVDRANQPVCYAQIQQVQVDQGTGALLPKKMVIHYPAEKMVMSLRLEECKVLRSVEPQRAQLLFSRQPLSTLPGFDLAAGRADSEIQRAGGGGR